MQPGQIITYTHVLTNEGNTTDTFTLTVTSVGPFPVADNVPPSITLTAGQTATFVITVTVPAGASATDQGVTVITATSTLSPSLSATDTDTTNTGVVPGLALDPDSHRAVQRTRSFHAGQTFAYSVTLTQPADSPDIFVEVERLSGRPRVVQQRSIQHITPGRRTFAFTVPADDLLAAWGAGRFEMRIYIGQGDEPVAVGRFRLVASPAPSVEATGSG